MPSYSKISKQRLGTCHTDIIIVLTHVIKYYDHTVVCGYRTRYAQEKAYAEGKSKLRYPGMHNTKPCFAVDVAPYEITGIDWGLNQISHFAGYVKAVVDMFYERGIITHKFRSGADWDKDNDIDDNQLFDPGHFELIPNPGETLTYYPR